MEYKEFQEDILVNKLFYPRILEDEEKWNKLVELKEKVSKIDFGCNFDEYGRCKATKHYPEKDEKGQKLNRMCCCTYCYENIGYLDFFSPYLKDRKKVAGAFKRNTGFWSKKGCKLPVHLRSKICLGYSCLYAGKLSKEEKTLIEKMRKV